MNATDTGTRPVIVGVDGSDNALRAVEWATRDARAANSPLHIISALGIPSAYFGPWPPSPDQRQIFVDEADKILFEAANAARSVVADIELETRTADGDPGHVLVGESRTARLTVLGPDGAGQFSRWALGSTVLDVTVRAHGPVVVVRGEHDRFEDGPVVVGIDGSPTSLIALDHAFQAARRQSTSLLAVHAWYDNYAAEALNPRQFATDWSSIPQHAEQELAEHVSTAAEKYPEVDVDRKVLHEHAKPALVDLSGNARLVVVGSRGRGRLASALLGSTSQALVTHAHCPVMVVREGAVQPSDTTSEVGSDGR